MKSFTGKFASVRGWALLLGLLFGAGMMISACGDEEVPAPTTPTPPPPAPEPEPEPEPTGPTTPENLRVTGMTSTSITWTWNAVEGAFGYQGQFSKDATFTDIGQAPVILAPTTSHTISGLSGNVTGHFRVRSGTGTSVADLTYSEWTDGVMGTTSAPPPATRLDAPGGVTTSATDDSVTLRWDEVDDAESYKVEYRLAGAGGNWNDADCGDDGIVEGTSCVVSDLDEGTEYEFRVQGLPADDDDDHIAGDWAETDETTTGRGPSTSTPTTGGTGMANVRWHNSGTNNAVITFVWDREGDAMYETAVLALAADGSNANVKAVTNVHVENPCANVADWDSQDAPRYARKGAATSQDITAAAPGTVMGLCVREEGSSDASFAWGISPAEEPNNGTLDNGVDVDDNKTVEFTWTDVNLKMGFDYEIALAADPERPTADNKIGANSGATSRAVQAACDAGRGLDDFTPDINLEDRTVSVDSGLNPHTGYLLCIRASNTAGTGAWAVPITSDSDDTSYGTGNAAEIYTRPAAPTRGGAPDVDSVDANGGDNERLGLTWEIGTRSVSNVPRQSTNFNVFVFSQGDAMPDADALKVADCGNTAPTGYETVTSTKTDGLSGFEVSVAAGAMTERVDFTRRVYMCAQADSNGATADVDKGAGPWTLTGPYNIGKPPTSLSTDSASVTSTAATIEIKGWNRGWFYKRYTTTAEFASASCQSVSAGTDDEAFSGLTVSTRYSVKAYGSQAACDADKRSLGSTSFTTKAP